tara:strand:+ start:10057 stop:10257 length:201 start_codon:yes stop_codon:yes gene_type:complete
MDVKALKIIEHYHKTDCYEATELYDSLRKKYTSKNLYDVILTYDEPFDILFWMLGRKRKKKAKEVN